jgi:hypothetical protein
VSKAQAPLGQRRERRLEDLLALYADRATLDCCDGNRARERNTMRALSLLRMRFAGGDRRGRSGDCFGTLGIASRLSGSRLVETALTMPDYPKPPYPSQSQPMPGSTAKMDPRPDHGENSYKGSGRLRGKRTTDGPPLRGGPFPLRWHLRPALRWLHLHGPSVARRSHLARASGTSVLQALEAALHSIVCGS